MTHPSRDQRRCQGTVRARVVPLVVAAVLSTTFSGAVRAHDVSAQRMTPIVVAVKNARVSVVSIRGQKTITEPAEPGSSQKAEAPRQVNGMGTGTIIDERGYILTNYHVVSDVRRIEVTLDDNRGFVADLIAYDA